MNLYSFKAVAKRNELSQKQGHLFVAYMTILWEDQEEFQCSTGYADKWAQRFKKGTEYADSDSWGREVLRELEKIYSLSFA